MGIGKILAISLGALAGVGAIGAIAASVIVNKQNQNISTSINETESISKEEKEVKSTPLTDEQVNEITKSIKGQKGDYSWITESVKLDKTSIQTQKQVTEEKQTSETSSTATKTSSSSAPKKPIRSVIFL